MAGIFSEMLEDNLSLQGENSLVFGVGDKI